MIERRSQRSIFEAYNSIMDEAADDPQLDGLVLVHDDVRFRSDDFEDHLRLAFADPSVGLVGVVGGFGQQQMSWWKSRELVGHVEHATGLDDFTTGQRTADVVDGLLMAVSPAVCRAIRLSRGGYPAFHGYDSELCSLVRTGGWKVVVIDTDIYHDCKEGPWDDPRYGQALLTWELRWGSHSAVSKAVLHAKRDILMLRAVAQKDRRGR